jgi:hypothetical protein
MKTMHHPAFIVSAVLFLVILTASLSCQGNKPKVPAGPAMYRAGDLRVGVTVMPDPPKEGNNAFTVYVADAQGKPATNAGVSFKVEMPGMNMPASEVQASGDGQGAYSGTGTLSMEGTWNLTVAIQRENSAPVSAGFEVTTGKKGVAGKGEPAGRPEKAKT